MQDRGPQASGVPRQELLPAMNPVGSWLIHCCDDAEAHPVNRTGWTSVLPTLIRRGCQKEREATSHV